VLGLALVLVGRPLDALVSVGVIAVNIVVSVVQEIRAMRTLDQVALLTRPTALVLRDGQERTLVPDQLVIGDVLRAGAGASLSASLVWGSVPDVRRLPGQSGTPRSPRGHR
jgi:cation-transporting ATPase E